MAKCFVYFPKNIFVISIQITSCNAILKKAQTDKHVHFGKSLHFKQLDEVNYADTLTPTISMLPRCKYTCIQKSQIKKIRALYFCFYFILHTIHHKICYIYFINSTIWSNFKSKNTLSKSDSSSISRKCKWAKCTIFVRKVYRIYFMIFFCVPLVHILCSHSSVFMCDI